MKKTQIESHQISINHKYFKECDELTFKSKNLWNATLYTVRQHYKKTGDYLNYNAVNKEFTHNNQPDYRALPAKVSKGTQRLLEKAYKGFFNKKGFRKPPGYLHKTKGRQLVHYEKGALSFKIPGFVKLSKTNILIKTNKNVEFVRIVPHLDYFTIEVGYQIEVPAPSATTGIRVASIDPGLNNLATITSNVMAPIIINGKPIKSINKFSNFLIAEKQKLSPKEATHKIRTYYRKRYNKIKDYFHKATQSIIHILIRNKIDTLVIGKNIGWKNKSKLKNFVYIPFNLFIELLTYKAENNGINVILQEESYTSKSSFISKDPIPVYGIKNTTQFSGKRLKRGLYQDNSGVILNADVNGSLNILRKSKIWSDSMWSDCISQLNKPIHKLSF